MAESMKLAMLSVAWSVLSPIVEGQLLEALPPSDAAWPPQTSVKVVYVHPEQEVKVWDEKSRPTFLYSSEDTVGMVAQKPVTPCVTRNLAALSI